MLHLNPDDPRFLTLSVDRLAVFNRLAVSQFRWAIRRSGHELVGAEAGAYTRSAVGFAAIADADDLNGGFVAELEEQPVVAATKAEAGLRWPELLHVAVAGCEVAIRAVEDVERGLAVDAAQIGAGFVGPHDKGGRALAARSPIELAEDVLVRVPSPRASEVRARSSAAAVSGVSSSSSTGAEARERDSGSTMTSRRLRTAAIFSSGSASRRKCACSRSGWGFASRIFAPSRQRFQFSRFCGGQSCPRRNSAGGGRVMRMGLTGRMDAE
jgi:hypothetical protein